ncbi:MAG: HigA family addiction module antitoxin [Candidatus Omnitrophota bacterium]
MTDKSKPFKYSPDYAVPPGVTISELLNHLGMTQVELADRTGRPEKTISDIVNGKQGVTPETALQFERVLGMSASFWNNLEKNYRESLVRIEEVKALEKQINWLENFPIESIIKNGWMQKHDNAVAQLQELLSFMGVASPKELSVSCSSAIFRKSKKIQTDPWTLCAWLRKGELEAQSVECKPYDKNKFKESLYKIREMTITPDTPSILPHWGKLCAESGVALVIIQELPKLKVNGATRWLKDKAVIQLSLLNKYEDILWFSFFHEAAHILLHGRKDVFIEDRNKFDQNDMEKEADQFAEDFLVPRNEYNEFILKDDFNHSTVNNFAKKIGVGPGIVVGRLQHEGLIKYNELASFKPRLCWKQPSKNN